MEGRPGLMLAWLNRPEVRGTPIMHLTTTTETHIYAPEHLNDEFRTYFMNLYSVPESFTDGAQDEILAPLPLPALAQEARRNIGGPVTVQEVRQDIKEMASGKTPGPDRHPVEF
ncbi:hypothetical protein NDU88_007223 [Pleurodeles waltl]|uniref:Uncharacterized protein n=1 Tax=Pleurodeles waltl TaxID=8319 RepID=A0AAV7N1I0_PLEWA|nr:hypothetical protein NDU88_007223 [Pleurodeles waltl]